MGFFDSISEAISNISGGGVSDQINGAVEDATSQIPGADQVQDVTDQIGQAADGILPGDQSGDEQQ